MLRWDALRVGYFFGGDGESVLRIAAVELCASGLMTQHAQHPVQVIITAVMATHKRVHLARCRGSFGLHPMGCVGPVMTFEGWCCSKLLCPVSCGMTGSCNNNAFSAFHFWRSSGNVGVYSQAHRRTCHCLVGFKVLAFAQDLAPPFRALAEVQWHQPLCGSNDAPASVTATVRHGGLRVQLGFGDVALLQGVMRDVEASLAAQQQVGCSVRLAMLTHMGDARLQTEVLIIWLLL